MSSIPRFFCIDCGKPVRHSTITRCRSCFRKHCLPDNLEMKQCSRGDNCINPLGAWLPRTTEYFPANKCKYDGLAAQCRVCFAATRSDWKKRNKDKVNAESRKRKRPNNPEYQRVYREQHREQARERSRKWRKANPDQQRSNCRRWVENNRERLQVITHRRLARKRNLPNTLTSVQWDRSLDYFDYSCAVCGRPRGLWHTLAVDHWIPLSDPRTDNPGTVALNCVPLCHGDGGCNNSKNASDPIEWLNRKFGKRKATQILKRINAYFEWVKEQDGEG